MPSSSTSPQPHAPTWASSARDWREAFSFHGCKPLIVCRGPIRLEAVQVFERLGTQPCGMLLSERDSVVYPRGLAPELRHVGRDARRVHRIPDYVAAPGQDKGAFIEGLLALALREGYTHLFAGYGFMAEDADFITAIKAAGLGFIGPAAQVVRQAGAKDAAKAVARQIGVSVTPGVDDVAARALLRQAKEQDTAAWLAALARKHKLRMPKPDGGALPADAAPEALATALLEAAWAKGQELLPLEALQAETETQVAALLAQHPGARLRLKHVGGGGGKGQRVIGSAKAAAAAVLEVLGEARALGPGANKNFLIELNIESTRHNEIQLLGNGHWCVALGGRDCSLQMHEQKLLEVSVTREMLADEAAAARAEGRAALARVLDQDRAGLQSMEDEAARFGEAVGLNSASTFECIVAGTQHYFMEMNTRIQVEHRVTEMVYSLRFTNPARPRETLNVDSLVEAMVWMALHGEELPRPERIRRHANSAEARINATNDALRPHAGGLVWHWSPPVEGELRDDQGIGISNPDTGAFMPYQLAGAYDSNVALVVANGPSRAACCRNLADILRRMTLVGEDVATNRAFHYGLLHWMLAQEPLVKPTTRFVQGYLTAVGLLMRAAQDLDLEQAWAAIVAREGPGAQGTLAAKATLILRPLQRLLSVPHRLAGWLAPAPDGPWQVKAGRVHWRENPLQVLERLYHYLRLEPREGATPEEMIWDHDRELLEAGLAFYTGLAERVPELADWTALCAALAQPKPPQGIPARQWPAVQAAHRGHQAGLSLLALPVLVGETAGFTALRVNARLEVQMPARFEHAERAAEAQLALAPPPATASDQIVAWTGGTFYARPSPEHDPYVHEGQHVEAGETVGLLEVMKMFNPVRSLVAGTVRQMHIAADSGVLVHKGQLLYELDPDAPLSSESASAAAARRRAATDALLKLL